MPSSPYLILFLLAAVSLVLRRVALQAAPSHPASGAIVMAIGIFGLAALQQMPIPSRYLTEFLALVLLIVSAHLAASYIRSGLDGTLHTHSASPVGRFAIGTWVAGIAVLLRMVLLGMPEWWWLAAALGCLALAVWLWFATLMVGGFRVIMGRRDRARTTGIILLSTVSTQSLVLTVLSLFPGPAFPPWAIIAFLALGYGFYGLGTVLIAQRYLRDPKWRLAEDWDNTNCILHGAMSISGLAAVLSGLTPDIVPFLTWVYTAVVFILVEGIELVRLHARVSAFGWRRGVFTYHPSQWSRNFTFGMFYAFTLAFSQRVVLSPDLQMVAQVQASILNYGLYVVLFFLVFELAIFLAERLRLAKFSTPNNAVAGEPGHRDEHVRFSGETR